MGSAAIMRDQLLQVLLFAALRNVEVLVVPATENQTAVFGGSFRLLRFRGHRRLVYLDTFVSGMFVDDPEYVAPYVTFAQQLREIAMDRMRSRPSLPISPTSTTEGVPVSAPTAWRKSRFSGDGGSDCVEVGWRADEVAVRDSKHPAGPVLAFPLIGWRAALARARH